MRLVALTNWLEDLGPIGLGTVTVSWLLGGTVLSIFGAAKLGQYPRLAEGVVFGVAGVSGLGGLVGFWTIAGLATYYRRGYRVKVLEPRISKYQERVHGGAQRTMSFALRTIGAGYPAPREVALPSPAMWENKVPGSGWCDPEPPRLKRRH
jgi:hypothetical protein